VRRAKEVGSTIDSFLFLVAMPRTWVFVLLLCILALVIMLGISVEAPALQLTTRQNQDAPAAKPAPPEQPIPYNHKKHLALGLKCQQCHPNPDPGDRMTFPAESKCMACHAIVAKGQPSIQKLAEYAKSGRTIPWVRIYVVPGWVYWSHRAHLEAEMTCEMCHGQVAEMEVMTKVSNVTTMAGCIECHRKNEASTGCKYCHADK
jgi:hypothetical protein